MPSSITDLQSESEHDEGQADAAEEAEPEEGQGAMWPGLSALADRRQRPHPAQRLGTRLREARSRTVATNEALSLSVSAESRLEHGSHHSPQRHPRLASTGWARWTDLETVVAVNTKCEPAEGQMHPWGTQAGRSHHGERPSLSDHNGCVGTPGLARVVPRSIRKRYRGLRAPMTNRQARTPGSCLELFHGG